MTKRLFKSWLRTFGWSAAAFSTVITHGVAAEPAYEKRVVLPGVAMHGINGLVFGKDGLLYGSSMLGTGFIKVDVKTGSVGKLLDGEGSGDDLALAADGSLAWSALRYGEVKVQGPNGDIRTVASNLPWVNPLIFDNAGKLYVGQVTQPDTLLEIDLSGKVPLRKIGEGFGGINAFELDGKGGLIAPQTFKGNIARIDLKTGAAETLVSGLGDIVAVRRHKNGRFYGVEWTGGRVLDITPDKGTFSVLTQVPAPLDNLAIGGDGTLYVSRPADNSIIAINPKTKKQRKIIGGGLAAPGGLHVTEHDGKPALLVADIFGFRYVDPATGAVTENPFDLFKYGSSTVAISDELIVAAQVVRGTVTAIRRDTGAVLKTSTEVHRPMGVVVRGNKILVADYDAGEIVELSPSDASQKRVVAYGLNGPVGLVARPDGSLVVSETGTGHLVEIDQNGAKKVITRDLRQPEGIALRADGHIVVAEVGSASISIIDTQGNKTRVAEGLPIGDTIGKGAVPVHLPTGVAVDTSGTIYVTCDIDNSIIALAPKR
jgi:sugar lactone lactonase YvrE